jgi:hypothetical protein
MVEVSILQSTGYQPGQKISSRKRTRRSGRLIAARRRYARLFTLLPPPEKDLEWSDQGVERMPLLSRLWRLVYQHRDLATGK